MEKSEKDFLRVAGNCKNDNPIQLWLEVEAGGVMFQVPRDRWDLEDQEFSQLREVKKLLGPQFDEAVSRLMEYPDIVVGKCLDDMLEKSHALRKAWLRGAKIQTV